MTGQIIYTPENPPTKGNAKKIWDVFVREGMEPYDLHYNFGPRGYGGSGTWACGLGKFKHFVSANNGCLQDEFWCGIVGKTMVYIQSMSAPFGCMQVGFAIRKCPFRTRSGCSYYSSTGKDAIAENDCPENCTTGTDEFLKQRNEEYEKWKRLL